MLKVLYADLRKIPSQLVEYSAEWFPESTTESVIRKTLGETTAKQMVGELLNNSEELIISWTNALTGGHSDIGGVGSLNWKIQDKSILIITYESASTTQAQIDEHIAWMLKHEE